MTRFVDDSGCSICGGFETFGSACACVSRSATTCRARKMSVPGSKTRRIRDRPGTDSERMSSRKATPLSRSCSSGTVISCSTSAADNPSASVWTSTVGGTNSGRTSTGICLSWPIPTTSVATAAATTSSRSRRLASTIERTAVPPTTPPTKVARFSLRVKSHERIGRVAFLRNCLTLVRVRRYNVRAEAIWFEGRLAGERS